MYYVTPVRCRSVRSLTTMAPFVNNDDISRWTIDSVALVVLNVAVIASVIFAIVLCSCCCKKEKSKSCMANDELTTNSANAAVLDRPAIADRSGDEQSVTLPPIVYHPEQKSFAEFEKFSDHERTFPPDDWPHSDELFGPSPKKRVPVPVPVKMRLVTMPKKTTTVSKADMKPNLLQGAKTKSSLSNGSPFARRIPEQNSIIGGHLLKHLQLTSDTSRTTDLDSTKVHRSTMPSLPIRSIIQQQDVLTARVYDGPLRPEAPSMGSLRSPSNSSSAYPNTSLTTTQKSAPVRDISDRIQANSIRSLPSQRSKIVGGDNSLQRSVVVGNRGDDAKHYLASSKHGSGKVVSIRSARDSAGPKSVTARPIEK